MKLTFGKKLRLGFGALPALMVFSAATTYLKSTDISGVAEAAQGTTRGASDTQKAPQQLVQTSAELRRLIEQFRVNASGSVPASSVGMSQRSLAAHA